MDFVELLMTVCTLSQPMTCDEQRMVFSSDIVSLRSCVVQAQPYIAQWIGNHPSLEVHSWRCAPSGHEKT